MREYFRVVNDPVTEAALDNLIACYGTLPSAYLWFLRETNGAEYGVTDSGGDCLVLWPAEEIQETNGAYQVREYLPGCVAIGSDGGGDAILLDRLGADPENWQVVRVGFGSLDPEECVIQAPSFAAWARSRFQLVNDPPPTFDLPTREEVEEDVDAILENFPEGDEPF